MRNFNIFTSVISDPFFRATTPVTVGVVTMYTSDFNISVLGCTEQYQFCNGDLCNAPDGLGVLTSDTMERELKMNPVQLATFRLLWRSAYIARIANQLFLLQDDVLQAKDRSFGPMDFATVLPPNQWLIEVGGLFNASLAMLQDLVSLHSSPANLQISQSTSYDDFVIKETMPADVSVCASTKIRSQAFYSFSSAKLAVVVLFAFMGMLLGNCAPQLASATRRRRAYWRKRLSGGLDPRTRPAINGSPLKLMPSWLPDDDESASTVKPTSLSNVLSFLRRTPKRFSLSNTSSLPIVPPPYSAQEWAATDILPLLRTALETNGVAGWTTANGGEYYPVRVDPEHFSLPWMPPEEKPAQSTSSSAPLSATKRRQEQRRKKLEAHEQRRRQNQRQRQAATSRQRGRRDDTIESDGWDAGEDDIVIYREREKPSSREKGRTFYVEDVARPSRSASASTLASNGTGGDGLVVSPVSPPAAAKAWPPTLAEFKKVSVTNRTFPQRIGEGELRRIESNRGIKGMIG
jgi:hypothetical protein